MPRNWSYGKKRKSGYRSGAEEKLAEYLTGLGVGFTYESEKWKYEKPQRGAKCKTCEGNKIVKIAIYTPDFHITESGVTIEYKGRLTAKDRSKYIAVQKSNPEKTLVFLFGSNNKLNKNSEKRYSDWATENEFDFAISIPPGRWLSAREEMQEM